MEPNLVCEKFFPSLGMCNCKQRILSLSMSRQNQNCLLWGKYLTAVYTIIDALCFLCLLLLLLFDENLTKWNHFVRRARSPAVIQGINMSVCEVADNDTCATTNNKNTNLYQPFSELSSVPCEDVLHDEWDDPVDHGSVSVELPGVLKFHCSSLKRLDRLLKWEN